MLGLFNSEISWYFVMDSHVQVGSNSGQAQRKCWDFSTVKFHGTHVMKVYIDQNAERVMMGVSDMITFQFWVK